MQMREPEQRQWQAEQEYGQYRATYSDTGEADQQQAYEAGLAANDYQDQKIYPQARQRSQAPDMGEEASKPLIWHVRDLCRLQHPFTHPLKRWFHGIDQAHAHIAR